MTFLNSAILFGLVAAAIPVIIHFLTRQKAKTILFSSLRFLKLLENQQIKRLKFKQILLLIIRTLIVLLLVLAFARPTMKNSLFSGIGASAKTSAVVILDNSLSMGIRSNGQLLYDRAKKAAQDLKDVFSFGDEIFGIYSTKGTPTIYEGARYNFETVSKIIQKSKLSQNSTDLTAALLEAKSILDKCENINKEIYLITDLQETGIKEIKNFPQPIIEDKNIKLFLIPLKSSKANNLIVTDVRLANQIIEKGKVFEIQAVIKNVGEKQARNKLVQVIVDGKRVGQTTVTMEPDESQTAKFKIIPAKTGLLNGSVLLEDDDLFYDNRRFFTFYVPGQIKVLLISDQEKDVRFLRLGLNPSEKSESQIKIDFKEPSQVEFGTMKNYQVVVLSNVPRINSTMMSSIENFLEGGGGLIIFPGADIDLRNYNKQLNKKLALPFFTETVGQLGSTKFNLSLGKVDFSHPIFSGVFDVDKKQIESPMFNFLTKVKMLPENDVVIEFSNGDPFLLESRAKKGRTLLFTSAVDPNWSDLYLKGIFVPLINRCVAYLANNAENENKDYLINDELFANLTGVEKYDDFKIETPGGNVSKVIPQIGEGNLKLNFKNTNSAGIYSLYNEKELVTQWAVNIDPDESVISAIDEKKFKKLVGDCKIIFYENGQSLVNEIKTTRYGKELWKFFVGLAFVLLIIEMILAREPEEKTERIHSGKFERAI